MLDSATYLVSEEVARRSGVIDGRYRTKDGRFILDNNDLKRVRLTAEEYVTGLQGIETITKAEAKELIKSNGYVMGLTETNEKEEKEDGQD